MPDRPVTPEQTNQPVTDPSDLIAEPVRQWMLFVTGSASAGKLDPRNPRLASQRELVAELDRLADALEAAQKERDELRAKYIAKIAAAIKESEARVRQLEEALAAKENTTPR